MLRIAGFWWIAASAIHGLIVITLYFDHWKELSA
jgi:hypothetical protein